MTLREAVLEEIATRNEYNVEAIKSLEKVYVEQHKQRAIAEQLVNYPSLIEKLIQMIEKNNIECADIHITKGDSYGKPHWVLSETNPRKAVLFVNTF